MQLDNPGLGLGPAVISFSYGAGTFLGLELTGQFKIGSSAITTGQKFAIAGTPTTVPGTGVPILPGSTQLVNIFSPGGNSQGIMVTTQPSPTKGSLMAPRPCCTLLNVSSCLHTAMTG